MSFTKILGLSCLSIVVGVFVFKENIIHGYEKTKQEHTQKLTKDLSQISEQWAAKVKEGGYILHFRHTEREKWVDVTGFDAYALSSGIDEAHSSFSKATCLTERGKETAKLIASIFTLQNIAVSDVYTSPSCRARQTSTIAFGTEGTIANSLLHRTAIKYSQHDQFAKELKSLIVSIDIVPGSNVILSGHGGTLSKDGRLLIDHNLVDDIDGRDEGGFIVLSNDSGVITAHYKFQNIAQFITSLVELPVK